MYLYMHGSRYDYDIHRFWPLFITYQDDTNPTVIEIQEGFTWPHFVLDDKVLTLVGLTATSVDEQFNIFCTSLGIWTVISRGHVLEVAENNQVFIKSLSVLDCKDLVQHTLPTIASCRSRLNVTSERAYTRHQFIRAELDKASPATSVAAGTPKATCSVKQGRPLTPASGSTVVK